MEEKRTNKKKRPFNKKPSGKYAGKERVPARDKDKANDPEWYTKVGQLKDDVATISFNNPNGVPITLSSESIGSDPIRVHGQPGILALYTVPTVGISAANNAGSSAINIAAQNLYSNIRYWNSGHANYDPADLMIYLMSLDGIYSYYAFMARIYGLARIFAHTNRYVGDALITACGVDAADIRANLSDFRAYINSFVLKASTFAAPNTMSWFQRHVWMYSSVFADEDVQKAQYYLYNPGLLWKYATDPIESWGMCAITEVASRVTTPTNGTLVPRTNPAARLKFATLRSVGNELIDAIYRDEDAGIISGDIIKAYGMDKLWKLSEIAPDYATLPIFSEEVLTQIHNTRFTGTVFEPGLDDLDKIPCLKLIQDPNINKGTLIFQPKAKWMKMNTYDAILDTWHDNPTSDDVIVATRNMIHGIKNGEYIDIDTCGSEMCTSAMLWYYDQNMSLTVEHVYNMDSWWYSSATAQAVLTKFNEYPHFLNYDNAGNFLDIMGELSNYTILSGENIRKMNESAILSELAVPHFGTASK